MRGSNGRAALASRWGSAVARVAALPASTRWMKSVSGSSIMSGCWKTMKWSPRYITSSLCGTRRRVLARGGGRHQGILDAVEDQHRARIAGQDLPQRPLVGLVEIPGVLDTQHPAIPDDRNGAPAREVPKARPAADRGSRGSGDTRRPARTPGRRSRKAG